MSGPSPLRVSSAVVLAAVAAAGLACTALDGDGNASEQRTPEVAPDAAPAPEVPPLHPAIDDLPEAVVTITAADEQEVRVDAKVADDPDTRRRGLMQVTDLPDGVGMLFLFPDERRGGFWMWNTPIPLDIAFADADGEILAVLAMDPCEDPDPSACPRYDPGVPYHLALEVRQGWLDAHGVGVGDHLRWEARVP